MVLKHLEKRYNVKIYKSYRLGKVYYFIEKLNKEFDSIQSIITYFNTEVELEENTLHPDYKKILKKIMSVFGQSFINKKNELILIKETNLYFSLNSVDNEIDLKCRLLEWCSRDATKSQFYYSNKKNEDYHELVLKNINYILETNFSKQEMQLIYDRLGNCIHHDLTVQFVNSNYDIKLLMF